MPPDSPPKTPPGSDQPAGDNASIAVVLVSGGLDSAVALSEAACAGFDVVALTFDYGQRHRVELEAATRVAQRQGVTRHIQAPIDLRLFAGSALTSDIPVPKDRAPGDMSDDIPVTYVPARNLIFLSYAAGLAETIGASDLYIGVNAIDYSGYPDCRPAFIDAFTACANLATRAGAQGGKLRIHTPLLHLTKGDIIRRGVELHVDFSLTHSCYDPNEQGRACGRCDACLLRKAGFQEARQPDPTRYA